MLYPFDVVSMGTAAAATGAAATTSAKVGGVAGSSSLGGTAAGVSPCRVHRPAVATAAPPAAPGFHAETTAKAAVPRPRRGEKACLGGTVAALEEQLARLAGGHNAGKRKKLKAAIRQALAQHARAPGDNSA